MLKKNCISQTETMQSADVSNHCPIQVTLSFLIFQLLYIAENILKSLECN